MTHSRRDDERPNTLYRSRSGVICGVCKGFAEFYNFDVFWTRVIFIILAMSTGWWLGVFMYFVAAMVMKQEPVVPLQNQQDEEFYHSYSGSRTMALHRLQSTFENLDRRLQRLENTVTTRDFDWDQRLRGE